MLSKILIDYTKENHHRLHLFFILIIVTVISFGLMTSSFRSSAQIPNPTPTPSPNPAGIWISQADLFLRPMSGAAWNNIKSTADSNCGVPDLSNQDDPTNVCIMAVALVYARTSQEVYYDKVVVALDQIIASGVYSGRALALGRELAAYVIAADLINLKGRDASRDFKFRNKLTELRTTFTGGGPVSLIECHENRPNNWGLHCGATRAAIAVYLGDQADLNRTAQVFRGWLGDRTAYAGFSYGDLSWQCDSTKPVGINPQGCLRDGHNFDGILPDDHRRGGSYDPNIWPTFKENYDWEALQGANAMALILSRQGFDVYNWSDKAILRSVRWLYIENNYPAEGDDSWQPHLVNFAYGTSFSAPIPASPGKNVGWTDWTHAGLNISTPTPTPTPISPVFTPTPGLTFMPTPVSTMSPAPSSMPVAQGLSEDFTASSIIRIFSRLACYVVRFGAIVSGIAIILVGIAFALSRGNSAGFASAKKFFLYAIIGGLVIYGVYTIILSVSLFVTGSTNLPWIPLSCP